MQFFSTVLVGAATLASVASAQVAINSWPGSIQAGQPASFEFTAQADGGPVTIILREGARDDLTTLFDITTDLDPTETTFTWTPSPEKLYNSNQYAYQITQGTEGEAGYQENYTGQFTIGSAEGTKPEDDDEETTSAAPTSTPAPTSTAESTVVEETTTAAPTTLSTGVSASPTSTTAPSSTGSVAPSSTAPTAPPGGAASSLKSPVALALAALGAFAFLQ